MSRLKRVKIGEARNGLTQLLRFVRRGGRVRIFDRDTAIAEIVPYREPTPEELKEKAYVRSLMERGILRPPIESGGFPLDLLDEPLPKGKASVLEALLEERRSGR